MFTIQPSTVVGFDIHMNEIRFVQLKQKKGRREMVASGYDVLPEGAVVEGKIIAIAPIVEKLIGLVKAHSLQPGPAVMALPMQTVVTKKISVMHALTRKQCEHEIDHHISRYLPTGGQEFCYDYCVLPKVVGAPYTALLVAARYDHLNDYVNSAEGAGFIIKIVDIDMYALIRLITVCFPHEKRMDWFMVIHVDLTIVRFLLVYENQVMDHQVFYFKHIHEVEYTLKVAYQHSLSMHAIKKIKSIFFIGKSICYEILATWLDDFPMIHVNFSQHFLSESAIHSDVMDRLAICLGVALRKLPLW